MGRVGPSLGFRAERPLKGFRVLSMHPCDMYRCLLQLQEGRAQNTPVAIHTIECFLLVDSEPLWFDLTLNDVRNPSLGWIISLIGISIQ
jgi:hypothetical protein